MGAKLLVVDDDLNICEMLGLYLENEGYEVKCANDGNEGVAYFKMYEPDLVLLDIMLPKKDGWQVCREIREMSSKPVIMVTAKGDVFDKVLGLELGADDFVTKPFEMKELSARIKAVLRRYSSHSNTEDDEVIKFDKIEVSLLKYELKRWKEKYTAQVMLYKKALSLCTGYKVKQTLLYSFHLGREITID